MSDRILPGDPEEVWIVVKASGAIVGECCPYRTEERALERHRAPGGERVIGPFRRLEDKAALALANLRCVHGRPFNDPCDECAGPTAGRNPAERLMKDLYRCRTCGCVWRENGDDTWSLADEHQRAKGCCDNVTELIPNLEPVAADSSRAEKCTYYDREESVVAYVDELTGGLSEKAEAKLRALLRRER